MGNKLKNTLKALFPTSTGEMITSEATEIANKLAPEMANKLAEKQTQEFLNIAVPNIKAMAGITDGGFLHNAGLHIGNDGAKYRRGISGSGTGTIFDHRIIRQNARKAIFDSPEAKAVVDRFGDFVVGDGIKLESTPIASMLGMTEQEAEVWATDVETKFDLYCRDRNANRSRSMTIYQAHMFYQLSFQRDNDIFVRLYYSKDKALINPLQFEFLDPDQIRGDTHTSSSGFNKQKDGIDRHKEGYETHYNVFVQDAKEPGKFEQVKIPAKSKDGKRIMMLHGYKAQYAGQGRGFSPLVHVLQDFQDLQNFKSAHINNAINQSNMTMYIKPSPDKDSTDPFGVESETGAGPQTNLNTNTQSLADASGTATTRHAPEFVSKVPGGNTMTNLGAGEDLKILEKAPAETYAKFVESVMKFLSASMSMPMELVTMQFGQNYSASRATLLLFWGIAETLRQEMATEFIQPIYEMWLSEEIAAGRIKAPGWSDPLLRKAYLKADYIGPAMPNIDPAKSAKAVIDNLKFGATNLRRAAREQTGTSFLANVMKNKSDFEKLSPLPFDSDDPNNQTGNTNDD